MKALSKVVPWIVVFALIFVFIKLLSVSWFYYVVYALLGTFSVGVTTLALLAKRKK